MPELIAAESLYQVGSLRRAGIPPAADGGTPVSYINRVSGGLHSSEKSCISTVFTNPLQKILLIKDLMKTIVFIRIFSYSNARDVLVIVCKIIGNPYTIR
ncbi:hypothetical protein [Limnofasciculus baicalensis]|uniref:hypothetical protein n=1 Tax=Limnofasciculus baicalensis TaxID=3064906 RepID=UPI0020A81B01|nr:hypothetical protein [Limnofasciculus baicalensis]